LLIALRVRYDKVNTADIRLTLFVSSRERRLYRDCFLSLFR
jgi:hypothetical protein